MALRIVMLGAPGAGKGTQAVRIAKDYNLPHISTGDIFRKHLKEGTDLGKQVQEYLNSGGLVPDELTCAIVEDRLKEADCADGFILDGFPRTVPQAEALDALLDKLNQNLTVAIDVEVPDEEIIDELTYQMVVFGFLFLTIGIITGAVWANSAWGKYWSWDPKETWSLITWFVYAIFLHLRMMRGWHGRNLALVSITGFMAVLFTYFGVNFLLSGLHSYG